MVLSLEDGRRRGTIMGCCSVTQRNTGGVDEVGPDEIELLELSGDNLGVWSLGESRLQLRSSQDEPPLPPPTPTPPPPPPPRYPSVPHLEQEVALWGRSREQLHHRIFSQQPIRDWEGQPAHLYGDILHSSLLLLYNTHTQETTEYFLVLFSFHLLLLSLDHSRQDFVYQGVLPLSGLSLHTLSPDLDSSLSPHMFGLSSPIAEPKVFLCPSAEELNKWSQLIEDRRHRSAAQTTSPAHCALSYLLPCDEQWKKDELKKYLLLAPIWQWEGPPIQHMGPPGYVSIVHIINSHRQGLQERLMVLFPQDVLLLSLDNKRMNLRYEGRLARHSIRAVERSALPGRLQFELTGDLVVPLQVSCTCLQDYQTLMFHLQQPDRSSHMSVKPDPPPIKLKLPRSRKESQEPIISEQCHQNGHS